RVSGNSPKLSRLRIPGPMLAPTLSDHYIRTMCGRVIQSSGPLRYSIVDGMNVRDSRVHNYPPRWMQRPSGASRNRVTRKGFGRPCHNATALYSSACYWLARLLRPQLTQYAEVLRTYVNTSTIVCRPTKMMLSG